jgi:hypothetical protein
MKWAEAPGVPQNTLRLRDGPSFTVSAFATLVTPVQFTLDAVTLVASPGATNK